MLSWLKAANESRTKEVQTEGLISGLLEDNVRRFET